MWLGLDVSTEVRSTSYIFIITTNSTAAHQHQLPLTGSVHIRFSILWALVFLKYSYRFVAGTFSGTLSYVTRDHVHVSEEVLISRQDIHTLCSLHQSYQDYDTAHLFCVVKMIENPSSPPTLGLLSSITPNGWPQSISQVSICN